MESALHKVHIQNCTLCLDLLQSVITSASRVDLSLWRSEGLWTVTGADLHLGKADLWTQQQYQLIHWLQQNFCL